MDKFVGLDEPPSSSDQETAENRQDVCCLNEVNKLEHSLLGSVNRVTFSHVHHPNDSDEACCREYVNSICRLRDPNVVSVYGIDPHPSGCCLYAEYPDRGNILTYMKRRGMTWEMLLDVTHDILKGLVFLEQLRTDNAFIDINIKPHNVWMFTPGTAKLAFCAFPWKPSQDEIVSEPNTITENSHDAYQRRRAHSINSFGSTLETLVKYTEVESTVVSSARCPHILTHLLDVCADADRKIIPTFTELLAKFRCHHPSICYTAWDISIHNNTVWNMSIQNKRPWDIPILKWRIHKRHIFKRKQFKSQSSKSLDSETSISDDETSDRCLGFNNEDAVAGDVNDSVSENDIGANSAMDSSCGLTEQESPRHCCDEAEFDISGLKEACLSDSWEDMTSCNGEDRGGSESYLWDEILPDSGSRTSSSKEGQISYSSDDSECGANIISVDSSDNGAGSDLDADQLDHIDGFVPGVSNSHCYSEHLQTLKCNENSKNNRQTYIRSKGGNEDCVRDSQCYGRDVLSCGHNVTTSVEHAGTSGNTISEAANFSGRCQGNALLDDGSVMSNREDGCEGSQTQVHGKDQREGDVTLGSGFVIIGKCAELSPLDFFGDYRIDILLLLRDIDDKQSELRKTSSLKDYRSCLIQCLSRIDSRDFKQTKATESITEDPNSRPFPVSAKIRLNPLTLRPWLKDWKPFETSLPESGFAWEPPVPVCETVPVCQTTPVDPVGKIPWYGDWQPFDMSIEDEVAWQTLPNDVIQDDQPTEQQLNVIHSRQNRKDFHDDRAMSVRRDNLALYFIEKYGLNWEVLNPYLDFVNRLDENQKELQCLAEDDFCFIIR